MNQLKWTIQIANKTKDGYTKTSVSEEWGMVLTQVVRERLFKKVTHNLTLERQKGAKETNHLYSDFHHQDELTKKEMCNPTCGSTHPVLQIITTHPLPPNTQNKKKQKRKGIHTSLKETLRNYLFSKMQIKIYFNSRIDYKEFLGEKRNVYYSWKASYLIKQIFQCQ